MNIISSLNPELLATAAVTCLLAQVPVTLVLRPNYTRDGLPLPLKKQAPAEDGTTTQQYRPVEILQYCHDVLSGELAARTAKTRKAQKAETEGEKE